MGAYTITKGGSIEIDLSEDSRDNGWTISGGVATHSSCNNGEIILNNANYVVGVPNTFRYVVSGYSSGSVQLRVGSSLGTSVTANGEHTDTLTPLLGDKIRFYSDGNLSVEILDVYTETEDETGTTLYFVEEGNKWAMYSSMRPEFMLKFISGLFTFKNGGLWENNTNPVRNNFFGEQYTSQITFYCNAEPQKVKNFYSMRQKSNKPWSVIDLEIPARQGKSNGQKSRLKKGNFRVLQGDYFGDFLRDMNDVRFNNELEALLNGAELQGNIMKVTIENADTDELRTFSIDLLYNPSEYTY